jgi:DNA-binding transcriptional regulator YiaG
MRTKTETVRSGASLRKLAAKVTWREADARAALAARDASNLTQMEFARRSGIGVNRLWWWRKRLGAASPSPAMLRVHVREEAPGGATATNGAVEIEVAGGRIVRVKHGFDPEELRRVVTALEGVC